MSVSAAAAAAPVGLAEPAGPAAPAGPASSMGRSADWVAALTAVGVDEAFGALRPQKGVLRTCSNLLLTGLNL